MARRGVRSDLPPSAPQPASRRATGYLSHTREARQNVYEVNLTKTLRHPIERHCSIGELIDAVFEKPRRRTRASSR